jgi:hypothetical protein
MSPPAAFYTGAGFALAATALLYLMFSPERAGADRERARATQSQ